MLDVSLLETLLNRNIGSRNVIMRQRNTNIVLIPYLQPRLQKFKSTEAVFKLGSKEKRILFKSVADNSYMLFNPFIFSLSRTSMFENKEKRRLEFHIECHSSGDVVDLIKRIKTHTSINRPFTIDYYLTFDVLCFTKHDENSNMVGANSKKFSLKNVVVF